MAGRIEDPYRHARLINPTDIRLLYLHQGVGEDPICVDLATVNLDEDPDFEAISYTWGDSMPVKRITCHGRTDSSVCGIQHSQASENFNITTNLFEELQRLRFPDRRRILWADAICINQEDPGE